MRVLVLTSGTGGGHDMRARALREWVQALTDWEIEIHHALESTHGVYRFGVHLYNWIQRTWPALHHIYFNYLELFGMVRNADHIFGAERFTAVVEDFAPDLVVSTHDHLNHGFFELARRVAGRSRVRCITYCGELGGGYGFSRHWVNPEADLFIGAVEEASRAAVALGMDEEKVWTGGFLLRPGFFQAQPPASELASFVSGELGFEPDRFILLLATGAAGANNHLAILDRLERRAKRLQVVALCGDDEQLLTRIRAWGARASAVHVNAVGYWDRMPLLMHAASAAVLRPGTGTTSEAITCRCPIIMNRIGGIMPQEMITLRYGRRHRIVEVMGRAPQIAAIIDGWDGNADTLAQVACNLDRARPRHVPEDIIARLSG